MKPSDITVRHIANFVADCIAGNERLTLLNDNGIPEGEVPFGASIDDKGIIEIVTDDGAVFNIVVSREY